MSKFSKWLEKEKGMLKKEFGGEKPSKILTNCLFVLLGALVYSIADSFFIIPMNIVYGGVSSLSIIFHWFLPGLSVNNYVLIFSWAFFVLGLFTIGLKYSLKSLVFAIAYPLFNLFFEWLISVAVIDGTRIFDVTQISSAIQLSNSTIQPDNPGLLPVMYLVSGIVGGALSGTGIGLTYVGGGSSGGTDVLSILMNKFFHIRLGTATFLTDSCIIFVCFFFNGHNMFPLLVGIITDVLCTLMIDKVFLGMNQYSLAFITSPKWKEINDFITLDLGRGTTLLSAKGGYTGQDLTVIEVCFDRQDYPLIKQSIYSIDPNAFVTVMSTSEILGYGFSRDTPKVDDKDVPVNPDETRKLIAKANRKRRKMEYED